MDDNTFALLRSSDPEERKRAIRELARSADREALRYLATVYKQDPDPDVRDLAVKAGKHIKKQIELAEWGEDTGIVVSDEDIAVEVDRSKPRMRNTLPDTADVREGKGLVDQALDLMMRGELDEAAEKVQSALIIAPELAGDGYYGGIISEVMGMPAETVLAKVEASQAAAGADGKRKRKRKNSAGTGAPSWTDVLVSLGLMFVLVVGVQIVSDIVTVAAMREPLEDFSAIITDLYEQEQALDPTAAGMPSGEFEQLLLEQFTVSSNFIIIIGNRLLGGVFLVLGYVISVGLVHLVSTMMLGGDGTFRGLLDKAVWPTIGYFVLMGIVQALFGIFLITGLANAFSSIDLMTATDLEIEMAFSPFISQAFGYGGFMFLIYIGYSIWMGIITGKNYDFSTGKGCLALFLSYIAGFVFACMCFFAFGTIIGSALSAIM